jgi:hypothetical protein
MQAITGRATKDPLCIRFQVFLYSLRYIGLRNSFTPIIPTLAAALSLPRNR